MSKLRTVLKVSLVFLLVISTSVGPVAGSHEETGECSKVDEFVYVYSAFYLNDDKCSPEAIEAAAVHEVEEADQTQERLDIYSAGLEQQQTAEEYTTLHDNHIQDTGPIAWNKAEIAVSQAFENGSSEQIARSEARQEIADYYATQQINHIRAWNNNIRSVYRLHNRSVIEGFNDDASQMHEPQRGYVQLMDEDKTDPKIIGDSSDESDENGLWPNGIRTVEYELVNGSTVEILEFKIWGHNSNGFDAGGTRWVSIDDFANGPLVWQHYSGSNSYNNRIELAILGVDVPDSNYATPEDRAAVVDLVAYGQRNQEIKQKNNDLQAETDAFVNQTWESYQNGEINATDVINRNNRMFEFGTADANESIGYYDSVGAWASMGYDTPDLNNTGHIEISYQGESYSGFLFARNAPNSSWRANTTYNASQIAGPVFFQTTEAKIELSGEFVVTAIRDVDGNSVDHINTTEYNYQTSNTSDINQKLDRVLELQQELEDREAAAGGGGGGPPIDVPAPVALGVGGGGVGLIYLITRSGSTAGGLL
jgi:hypothetical protein